MTAQTEQKKLRYPIGVFFLVFNGLADRFAYYGIKAVLILYLSKVLLFSEDVSTQVYHLFFMFCTFTPLFGAMLADSVLGKFKTILIFTIVYIVGNLLLAVAATPPLPLPQMELSIFSLVMLAIGTGFVKPCVVAMGGDQFTLPEQENQLKSYFSLFYFAISAGGLVATFVTPIFRTVSCFDGDCYTLAYTATSGVMIIALIAFIVGKAFYKPEIKEEEGNIIVEIFKCIFHALGAKWTAYREGKLTHFSRKAHWLDYAVGKYERELVEDVKAVLKVLVLYLPLPMFWALMEQQGSRWTLQASRMNGDVFGYLLKPDHIQVVNPLLVLALIPFFDKCVYPCLGKFNILSTPLPKLACGGLLASVAFMMSGFVELNLEENSNMLTTGIMNLNSSSSINSVILLNKLPCNFVTYSLDLNGSDHHVKLFANESLVFKALKSEGNFSFHLELDENSNNQRCSSLPISNQTNGTDVTFSTPKNQAGVQLELELDFDTENNEFRLKESQIQSQNTQNKQENSENLNKDALHMLWLLPQYIVITIAEVMFAVTGMEFSYSQAPSTMKSVMQSAWLLTIASGNLIVAIIAKAKFFSDQSSEFFLFAALMFVDIIIFIWMANSYTKKNPQSAEDVARNSKSFKDMRAMSLHNRMEKRPTFRRTVP